IGQELHRIGLFDVLGDHEHRRAGHPPARLERGAQTLVAKFWWQTDIHHREVGVARLHLAHECPPVADGRHHLDPVVAQQTGEAVSEKRQVLRDHYAHGSSARIVVGPPGGLVTRRLPSSASTRCLSPLSPAPCGSAPPTPSSLTSSSSSPPA